MSLKRIMGHNRSSISLDAPLVDLLIEVGSSKRLDESHLLDFVKQCSLGDVVELSLRAAQAASQESDTGRASKLWLFLRRLPQIISSRRTAVEATLHASLRDPEFRAVIARADKQRDARNWAQAEYLYWTALQLYPLHRGYFIQYAHVLKEQEKFADAEVFYRTALALGELSSDLISHIKFTAHKRGADLNAAVLRAIRAFWSDHSEIGHFKRPPTRQDLADVYNLFLGRESVPAVDVAKQLNQSTSLEEVLLSAFSSREFIPLNRQFLTYLAETKVL